MADLDPTIVILRDIQNELTAFRQSSDAAVSDLRSELRESVSELRGELRESMSSMRESIDVLRVQVANVDHRLVNVEYVVVNLASQVGVEAQSTRHRAIRQEGALAELEVRVSSLEAIVKSKPSS